MNFKRLSLGLFNRKNFKIQNNILFFLDFGANDALKLLKEFLFLNLFILLHIDYRTDSNSSECFFHASTPLISEVHE